MDRQGKDDDSREKVQTAAGREEKNEKTDEPVKKKTNTNNPLLMRTGTV